VVPNSVLLERTVGIQQRANAEASDADE